MEELLITPRLKEAHRALSAMNTRFLEYVQEHPQWLDRSRFSQLVQWSDATVYGTLQPWPLLLVPG